MKKLIALTVVIAVLVCSIGMTVTAAQGRIWGDADNSGSVDILDVTTIQLTLAQLWRLDEESLAICDVDGDETVSVVDCTTIQQFIAELIPDFPVNNKPTEEPTRPTEEPTRPTETPTEEPTRPTETPTEEPTKPTETPTEEPTKPTETPTEEPTKPTEPSLPTEPEELTPNEMELEVLRIVNEERAKEGLKPLEFGYHFYECAVVRANECLTSFSHTRPDGSSCFTVFDQFNVSGFYTAGENIAYNYTSAANVMKGWMNSPGHRSNILHPDFTHIAIAMVETYEGSGHYSAVQLFTGEYNY